MNHPEGSLTTGSTSRRDFLRRGVLTAGGLWALSLQTFMTRRAHGQTRRGSPYGPLQPVYDESTGLPLLELPEGFRYASFGWRGDFMWDGFRTPSLHDGMGVVAEQDGMAIMVRNHEVGGGAGGTTSLAFDLKYGQWLGAWASLGGTSRNCAGGVTPWGTWLTCEETTESFRGFVHEVGPFKGSLKPLSAMGRFTHEAVAVDPYTGVVYETEDSGSAGFYAFEPFVPGKLGGGGELYMLRVLDEPNLDLGRAYPVGTIWDIDWVHIPDPLATKASTYQQGAAKGAARFRRLEGCWAGLDRIYFLSTSGGQTGMGQVFEYDPVAETLTLIYDSPAREACENPDNMVVTPRGGLLLCEDGSEPSPNPGERLLGLTLDGYIFTFAQNNIVLEKPYSPFVPAGDYRRQEFAGATYSLSGEWLFVNIQTPGITFAITGPWGQGPL